MDFKYVCVIDFIKNFSCCPLRYALPRHTSRNKFYACSNQNENFAAPLQILLRQFQTSLPIFWPNDLVHEAEDDGVRPEVEEEFLQFWLWVNQNSLVDPTQNDSNDGNEHSKVSGVLRGFQGFPARTCREHRTLFLGFCSSSLETYDY